MCRRAGPGGVGTAVQACRAGAADRTCAWPMRFIPLAGPPADKVGRIGIESLGPVPPARYGAIHSNAIALAAAEQQRMQRSPALVIAIGRAGLPQLVELHRNGSFAAPDRQHSPAAAACARSSPVVSDCSTGPLNDRWWSRPADRLEGNRPVPAHGRYNGGHRTTCAAETLVFGRYPTTKCLFNGPDRGSATARARNRQRGV
jgi:hypothetical protein